MPDAAIGVDVGGTNLRFGLVGPGGEILARKRIFTDAQKGVATALSRIANGIDALKRVSVKRGFRAAGVGVGVPGVISHKKGIVHFSPNLPEWKDIPLRDYLRDAVGLPVIVENDANAHALGEAWLGVGKGAKSLVCLTLGTGVGGGIILGGKIWRGVDGMAGEVGHITVNPTGPKCPCGNRGCLEKYSSATAVVEITASALSKDARSSLSAVYKKDPSSITAEVVKDAALDGDALAKRVYAEAGQYLGIAVADLINLLNVERVVIGGGMAGAWELFIGPLLAEVNNRALDVPASRCEVVKGSLGDDAGILGAARMVFKNLRPSQNRDIR